MILMTIFEAFYAVCIVFVTCERGEQFTITYGELENVIKEFDWYLFSIEIQRLLPIILLGAQQPIELQCFGSLSTSRESFKKVRQSLTKRNYFKRYYDTVQFNC